MGPTWPILAHFGATLAHLRPILAYLGAILAQFRPKVRILMRKPTPRPQKIIDFLLVFMVFWPFGLFGFMSVSGTTWAAFCNLSGSITALLGAILAPSWPHLAPSGHIWVHLGAILAPCSLSLGQVWPHLGSSWVYFGPSWLTLPPSFTFTFTMVSRRQ